MAPREADSRRALERPGSVVCAGRAGGIAPKCRSLVAGASRSPARTSPQRHVHLALTAREDDHVRPAVAVRVARERHVVSVREDRLRPRSLGKNSCRRARQPDMRKGTLTPPYSPSPPRLGRGSGSTGQLRLTTPSLPGAGTPALNGLISLRLRAAVQAGTTLARSTGRGYCLLASLTARLPASSIRDDGALRGRARQPGDAVRRDYLQGAFQADEGADEDPVVE